ncbi:MAG: tail fiber domain-containing protein, partial [bacterium]|nr:tail fiber domain-containing protein [bacterium]
AWYKGGTHNDAERNPGGGAVQMAIDSSGRVGIGTASPADKLTVDNGDLRITGGRHRRLKIVSDRSWTGIELVARQDGEAGHPYIDFTHGELDVTDYGVRLYAPSNDLFEVGGGVLRVQDGLRVDGNRSTHLINDGTFYRYNGQVYINVDDNLYIRDSTSGTRFHFNTNNGWLYAYSYQHFSDTRLKKGIRRLGGCLSKVLALHGVSFRWKESALDHGRQIGLLAQEVEEVFPELVDTDSDGVKSLSYFGLVTPLIEAIKEQQAQIDSLRARLERLPA